jgi:metal-sulfur cluster biosynthetic enzyme/nitrite reductase/ring-hydroxylating ferredoxin subunit
MPAFVKVASASELPDPGKMLVEVDGDMVALFHVGGGFHAIDDVCTHDGGPLADGELCGFTIACPRHGAKFDVRTGAALTMPAVRPTRSHEVKVEGGDVYVRLREHGAADGPSAHATTAPAAAPVPQTPVAGSAAPASTGPASPAATASAPGAAGSPAGSDGLLAQPLSEDSIREILKDVKDPELFVNIVDLGLIYGVTLAPVADAPGKRQICVDMTMTSPACPAGPQLIADTKRALGRHGDVAGVEVRIVMDPPWTPDRMTEAARDQLGIF